MTYKPYKGRKMETSLHWPEKTVHKTFNANMDAVHDYVKYYTTIRSADTYEALGRLGLIPLIDESLIGRRIEVSVAHGKTMRWRIGTVTDVDLNYHLGQCIEEWPAVSATILFDADKKTNEPKESKVCLLQKEDLYRPVLRRNAWHLVEHGVPNITKQNVDDFH